MNISILGCGRWGTFLAWYTSTKIKFNNVFLYGRKESDKYNYLLSNRKNEYLSLGDKVIITSDLKEAVAESEIILISINSQNLRGLLREISLYGQILNDKKFVLCMKGIEANTGKRLSQVFDEEIQINSSISIWVGPGHVQDFCHNRHGCMLICSNEIAATKQLVSVFNSDLIRFYYSQDMIGNEIGAASKNVMGIVAGILDGINESGLKGALMSRGSSEISRLIKKMGGNELTAYGLSHLGDYEATLFSQFSNNRMYGEKFIRGEKTEKLAEGIQTTKALVHLGNIYNTELPICNAAYDVIFNDVDYKVVLKDLFLRDIKPEFYH